jgi:hypothetical protein
MVEMDKISSSDYSKIFNKIFNKPKKKGFDIDNNMCNGK